eukprot:CAMPEP_0201661008 /NCGR_PEP_ID=MMETSP0494-20130426/3496_1 /ASSEMBLY_ACC=CAM_ASM_000839 /TAXON_ID=420259 /ORGANISM="Thalassiosira gravida, Strain GMp14c1" /LENGTH=49 /DNA_ID= /DNA_START= /DNA_END= /DNA_ORIENTATION=
MPILAASFHSRLMRRRHSPPLPLLRVVVAATVDFLGLFNDDDDDDDDDD